VDSYEAYCRKEPLPLILFIIDGFTNFPSLGCGEKIFAKLHEYLRDGANYGIRYILSINHTNEISSRAKMEIDMHVALQAKDRYEYSDILDAKCTLTPPPDNGSGMCLEEERPLVFHAALLDAALLDEERASALRSRLDLLRKKYSGIPAAERLPMLDLEESFADFCAGFTPDRLPLGYATQEMKAVALPFQQWHSISLYFGNPKGVAPVLSNLLTAAEHCGMEVIAVKRSSGSVLDEIGGNSELTKARPCVSGVLSCTEEGIASLSERILSEINSRNVLRDEYCARLGIPETVSGRSRKAAKYIRANSKPLLVLIERFSDLCALELDEVLSGKLGVYFNQMFGYNIYFAAGFYPDDDSRITLHKLMKVYNRSELMLLFGGRYNKLPMLGSSVPLSQADRMDSDLHQFILRYQMEYYTMAMPGVRAVTESDDPDEAPIV
jgi:hypothetical protein